MPKVEVNADVDMKDICSPLTEADVEPTKKDVDATTVEGNGVNYYCDRFDF